MINNEVFGATLNLNWHEEINLIDIEFERKHQIIKDIPNTSGIYIFWRKFADTHECLYIGIADNLQRRIDQQLNHRELIEHIKDAKKGPKLLSYAEIKMHSKCNVKDYLDRLETFLIAEAINNEHNLFNKKKTKSHLNEVINTGDSYPNLIDDVMYIY